LLACDGRESERSCDVDDMCAVWEVSMRLSSETIYI
jgi:hypothetical protein